MKKLVLTSVLSLLVLTGCGEKETIVCTQNKKISDIELNDTVKVYIEDSKFKGLDREVDVIIPEILKKQKSELISKIEDMYKQPETTLNAIETEQGAKITINMTTEQAKKISESQNDKTTKKDVIETYENEGFKCE